MPDLTANQAKSDQKIHNTMNTMNDTTHTIANSSITSSNADDTVPEHGFKSRLMVVLFTAITLLTLLPLAAHAESNALASLFGKPKAKFLPVEQAFQTIPKQAGKKLTVDFVVTPKHYVYKDRVKITLPNGKQLTPLIFNQKHTMVNDPEFGKVAVFQKNVRVSATLPASVKAGDTLKLRWQGCAKAGLCYPPVTEKITIKSIKKPLKEAAKKKLK